MSTNTYSNATYWIIAAVCLGIILAIGITASSSHFVREVFAFMGIIAIGCSIKYWAEMQKLILKS